MADVGACSGIWQNSLESEEIRKSSPSALIWQKLANTKQRSPSSLCLDSGGFSELLELRAEFFWPNNRSEPLTCLTLRTVSES